MATFPSQDRRPSILITMHILSFTQYFKTRHNKRIQTSTGNSNMCMIPIIYEFIRSRFSQYLSRYYYIVRSKCNLGTIPMYRYGYLFNSILRQLQYTKNKKTLINNNLVQYNKFTIIELQLKRKKIGAKLPTKKYCLLQEYKPQTWRKIPTYLHRQTRRNF